MNHTCKNLPVFKMTVSVLLAGLLLSGGAAAAEEETARALKLYEQHHYEEASRLLNPELAGMSGSGQIAANLALGMIHLSNAKLYRELYQTALIIELDYLTQLGKQKTGAASRMVELFLGKVLVQAGKPAEAIAHLRRYISFVGMKQPARSLAEVELGVAYSRQNKTAQAAAIWSKLDKSTPEVKAALAGAYAYADLQKFKPANMADEALSAAKKQQYTPSSVMLGNLLRAYTYAGSIDKALALLNSNDYKEASSVEKLGASKTISFYDISLLEDMSLAHLGAAVKQLERANHDSIASSKASYFLADAYLQQGKLEVALRAAADFLSQKQIPEQYRDIARVYQASAQYKSGKHADAISSWQVLAEKSTDNPAQLAEVLMACTYAGADCVKLEKIALASVGKGEGKKFYPLDAALGKYYLLTKDYSRAIEYMEAGRDKANKNKIEENPPLMLVDLAEAHYRNKNYSENLEIYFELGKQFPVVRQIQEAMQGIYSMQQKSAGEVKIY
jgi:tetratricopeptide (TPR) repeat protein